MAKKFSARTDTLRQQIAQEAARVMAQQGIDDFLHAKRKAAERLGVHDAAVLPRNTEIEAALREYQRLFAGVEHTQSLREQRRAALEVMLRLAEFSPRLVGSVLHGTAGSHSNIELHLFADPAEAVIVRLLELGVEHRAHERRVRMDGERIGTFPALRFDINDWTIEAVVFSVDGIRQAPYSPTDGKPMKRADAKEVRELIGE